MIGDIAYLTFLAEQLFGGQLGDGELFEVAVIHHTQCGTGFLADPAFRHQAAGRPAWPTRRSKPPPSLTRTPPSGPMSSACSPRPRSHRVSVSGHVYDVATGRVTTTLDARYP